MRSATPRGRRGLILWLFLLAAVAAPACAARRRPPPPRADRDPLSVLGGAEPVPVLDDLLAAYPLGDRPSRTDLMGTTDDCSVFLLQSRTGVARHFRRTHRERTSVLAGSGTCFIEGRSYPAVEGTSFRVESGTRSSIVADAGTVFTALVILEPPLTSMDEDWVPVGD